MCIHVLSEKLFDINAKIQGLIDAGCYLSTAHQCRWNLKDRALVVTGAQCLTVDGVLNGSAFGQCRHLYNYRSYSLEGLVITTRKSTSTRSSKYKIQTLIWWFPEIGDLNIV